MTSLVELLSQHGEKGGERLAHRLPSSKTAGVDEVGSSLMSPAGTYEVWAIGLLHYGPGVLRQIWISSFGVEVK